MEDLWFELIFPLTGLALLANIVLFIIAIVKKKLKAGGIVFVILFAIGAPIVGAIWGMYSERDNGAQLLESYIMGVLYGYVVGQFGALLFLIFTLSAKRNAQQTSTVSSSKASVSENTIDTADEDEII